MESSDGYLTDDIWSPSLREELFADYSLSSSWDNDVRTHDDLSFPRLPFPTTNFSDRSTLPQQPPRNNTPTPSIFGYPNSTNLERKHSHLDLPNFPLATDPRGGPSSNSSGRPLPTSSTHQLHSYPTPPPPSRELAGPRAPSPFSSFSSSSVTSYKSETSDAPWPDGEQDNFDDFVDLTRDSSPPTMRPARRSVTNSSSTGVRSSPRRKNPPRSSLSTHVSATSPNPAKRRKTGTETNQPSERSKRVEEVDLIDVDNDKGLSKVLEHQRMATIKAQQDQANKPVKLSTVQCIICMENMKDVTTTSCGHLFCHSCLMEALIAGENQGSEPGKGVPKCPVCRKKVIRPLPTDKRDMYHVVPLCMKLKAKTGPGKGKGKALD